METNEIMRNEEFIEATEQAATSGSGRGFKVVAGVGLAVLTGVIVYKYLAKPVMAKLKAQKELACVTCAVVDEDKSIPDVEVPSGES